MHKNLTQNGEPQRCSWGQKISDCGNQISNSTDKDSKGQRKLEKSAGGMLLALEGHYLEYSSNSIDKNGIEWN